MKQISFFLMGLLLAVGSVLQAKERVIDRPPFLVRNTTSIEVGQVVLSDTATVLHIYAKYQPKYWIKIAPESYLKDNNGRTYALRSGIGITPGKEFWMPESGEAEFRLVFPPLEKGVTSIDFTEGEGGDGAFSIWGIQLKGKLPKLEVPTEIKPSEVVHDEVLPQTELNYGKAVIRGKLLDYRSGMSKQLDIYKHEAVQGFTELGVAVNPDGTFLLETSVLSTVCVTFAWGGSNVQLFLEPGKTRHVCINLRELSRRASKYHSGEKPYGRVIYSDSPWDKVMNEWIDAPVPQSALGRDHYRVTMEKALKMESLAEYKQYAQEIYEGYRKEIEEGPWCPVVKQLLHFKNETNLFESLDAAIMVLVSSRREQNKLTAEQEQAFIAKLAAGDSMDYYNLAAVRLMDDMRFLPLFGQVGSKYNMGLLMEQMKLELPRFAAITEASRLQESVSGEFTPLTEEQKVQLTKLPKVYADFLTDANKALLAKLEANRKKSGFTVNEAGEVVNEDLFASIIAPFHGKVVLVDFWATWCAPCRIGHQEMKPMKEELKDKEIVYIYLAGENSPLATWQNMIPEIPGGHYRLTAEQWQYLCREFGVEGVPTYLIVDKEGKLSYKCVGFPGAGRIKEELLKLL